MIVEKPWGSYEVIKEWEGCLIKILYVNPGERLSLQLHEKRNEFWYCLYGQGKATVDFPYPQFYNLFQGNCVEIPPETMHRLENTDEYRILVVLEVQKGVCDEEDIVRFEDEYGRKT